MKILILGASGQIGKEIFKRLSDCATLNVEGTSRKEYNGLIRFDPFSDDWSKLGIADVVINCIGQIYESAAFDFTRIHSGVTALIIKNRTILGNPRIIQISALGSSREKEISFLRTKGEADDLLLKEVDTYVIRPSIVCTPDTMLVKKLRIMAAMAKKTNNRLMVPKGFLHTKVQPILIEDLTELIERICIATYPENIVNAVGAEEFSFYQLIEVMEKNLQIKFKIKEVNEGLCRAVVKYIISPLFPNLINFEQYKLLFEDNVADITMTNKILRREPLSTIAFWEKELRLT